MKDSGFTIIEVVIASFVFAIIGIIVGNIFVQSSALQRRGFSAQAIQENMQFSLELMAKEIRVSAINTSDNDCTSSSLSITHPTEGSIVYGLSNGVITRNEGGFSTDITSTKVNVIKLAFCITGASIGDDRSPRVTIVSTVQNRNGPEILTVPIQTTVTSRDIQAEFVN